jgi:membrane protein YqaA with SNARE-associated domain
LSTFLHHLLRFLFHLGYAGPFVMGVMDSSFLFLPFGNDLLVVALVARHHDGFPFYLVSAVCGSTLGVFFLDLIARKAGEAGVRKVAGNRRFEYLKRKVGQRGMLALAVGCLAPPPFPFTAVVATTSGLGYPRAKLLITVAASRAVRFAILGLLAIKYGRTILHITSTAAFRWTMIAFIVVCVIGSVFSIMSWVRASRRRGGDKASSSQPAVGNQTAS